MSMTIQSSVKDKILATLSETSKVENTPAEMLRDLDQQMEKRADDGKANVVTDALSRKERVKPRRVRAMAMTIPYGVRGMILAAQSKTFKQENVLAERLHGLDQQMEKKEEEFVLYGSYMSSIGPELVQETTDKVVLIKEKLKAVRDHQKSCADNRRKPLEFEIEVDKTLRFVEEPIENSDCEVMRKSGYRKILVKLVGIQSVTLSKLDEISLRRGYCDNHDLSRGRNGPQGLEEPTPDEVLRELCDKNYHQLLPLIAEKMQKEKEQQDKLNAGQAPHYTARDGKNQRNHEESYYSESKTPTARTELKRRHRNRRSRSPSPVASVFKRLKQNRPSPRPRPRKEGGVFNRLGGKERNASARSDSRHQGSHEKETDVQPRKNHHRGTSSRETGGHSESEDSEGCHWKSKSRRHKSNTYEDDLSQPWTCKEKNSFHTSYPAFQFPKDKDAQPVRNSEWGGRAGIRKIIKSIQAAQRQRGGPIPTWCHMFNSTLTGNARVWFDKLPRESIDSYEDLRAAFRENYLQQTKHIKDPVEIHHIKQRNGESTENFMERYKTEVLDMEGALECMKISGFMHGITHPELIKRLYEKIPRSMDEMYRVTTSFLQGEVAAFSYSRKKTPALWRQPEERNKPNFKKGFKNKQRSDQKPDRFSLLTKTPKEIFSLEKGKFKAPPPMVTPVEKRDPNKYCEFHADTGHSTDECMQLRKQIDKMIKSGKLSQFIKELK
ncbi:reverse transcriptase domain-containing protein [Tanacetum coccineum]